MSNQIDNSKRLIGVDLARGLAVIMMTFVDAGPHAPMVDMSSSTELDPNANEAAMDALNPILWLFVNLPVWCSGRANVLFFVISGVALSLVARNATRSLADSVLYRRGAVLIIAGVMMKNTFWEYSILEFYGVMFLLSPWLLQWSTRRLFIFALVSMIGGSILVAFAQSLSLHGTLAANYFSGRIPSGWLLNTIVELFLTDVFYPLGYWAGYFCLGMAIGRLNLHSKKLAVSFLLGGFVLAVSLSFASNHIYGDDKSMGMPMSMDESVQSKDGQGEGMQQLSSEEWEKLSELETGEDFNAETGEGQEMMQQRMALLEMGLSPEVLEQLRKNKKIMGKFDGMSQFHDYRTPFDWTNAIYSVGNNLQRPAVSITILGFMLLLPLMIQRWLWPLAALGMIPLTGYVLHVEYGSIMILIGGDTALQQVLAFCGLIGVAMLVGVLSQRYLGAGPLEWGLKKLSGSSVSKS